MPVYGISMHVFSLVLQQFTDHVLALNALIQGFHLSIGWWHQDLETGEEAREKMEDDTERGE